MKIALHLGLVCCCCLVASCKRDSVCGEGLIQEAANPQPDRGGNKLLAKVVQVNCGATTDFGIEVRLLRDDGKPVGQGDGAVFVTYRGTPKVSIQWSDANTLDIQCPDCKQENVTLKTTRQNFTDIQYSF